MSTPAATILLVEDEPDLRPVVRAFLEQAGYRVVEAGTVAEASSLVETENLDAVVLDWMLPDGDGPSFCQDLKLVGGLKVLILTARTGSNDEVDALEAGADDYLRKPFDPRVLVARVKRLLRGDERWGLGPFVLHLDGRKAFLDGVDLALTRREWDLFSHLAHHRRQILSRGQLFEAVWGPGFDGDERTVDTHIRRLRAKLGDRWITTHRGLGYCLEVDDA